MEEKESVITLVAERTLHGRVLTPEEEERVRAFAAHSEEMTKLIDGISTAEGFYSTLRKLEAEDKERRRITKKEHLESWISLCEELRQSGYPLFLRRKTRWQRIKGFLSGLISKKK